MDIKDTFLKLTSRTYPHGTEYNILDVLPDMNFELDDYGNLYRKVGDSYSTMFTCHLDTATIANTDIVHIFDGDYIKTDGKTILGADDKAGVTIMLHMIENEVPGLYYFFVGEEVGCVGSKKVAESFKSEKPENITKVISFDRRGTSSIITHQFSQRCCSNEFGEALAKLLNESEKTFLYRNDSTGIHTDSAQFIRIYPECTNISVGYYSEHTFLEKQDIKHLEKLAESCIKIDWESLPIKRDPSKIEYGSYYDDGGFDFDSSYGSYWSGYNHGRHNTSLTNGYYNKKYEPAENVHFFKDPEYLWWSTIRIDKNTGEVKSVDLCKNRINKELEIIISRMIQLDIPFDNIRWDGVTLVVDVYGELMQSNRTEILDIVPELDFWKKLNETEPMQLLEKNPV